ncbi:MAG: hypothetical protein Q9183_006920, partial [Haloplaca sp. 2 TL-2023]
MPAVVEGHIPAWRRLGLKLKNVPDEAPTASSISKQNPSPPPSQKKRKAESNVDEHEGSKPAKVAKKVGVDHHFINDGSSVSKSNGTASATPSKPHLTRKSVSFTPETKTQDGESNKDLYNSWIVSQKSIDPAFDPSSLDQDALKAVTPPSVTPSNPDSTAKESTAHSNIPQPKTNKKKKKKKRNKSKSTSLTSESKTTVPPTPA